MNEKPKCSMCDDKGVITIEIVCPHVEAELLKVRMEFLEETKKRTGEGITWQPADNECHFGVYPGDWPLPYSLGASWHA